LDLPVKKVPVAWNGNGKGTPQLIESMLTGESMPVEKKPSDKVIGRKH